LPLVSSEVADLFMAPSPCSGMAEHDHTTIRILKSNHIKVRWLGAEKWELWFTDSVVY
jgi:hypothetical protein